MFRARQLAPLLQQARLQHGLGALQLGGPCTAARPFSGVVAGQDTPVRADKLPQQVKEDYNQVKDLSEELGVQESWEAADAREARAEEEREQAMDGSSGWIGYGESQAAIPVPPDADIYSGGAPQAGEQATTSKEEEGARERRGD